MNNVAKMIIGGATVLGLATADYRTYKIKKMNKALEEEQIIEISTDQKEDSSHK